MVVDAKDLHEFLIELIRGDAGCDVRAGERF